MKSYLAQQQEIERLTALIEKFKHKPKKAAMARSKKKVLERMEKIERPSEDRSHIFTEAITPRVPGSKWVLDADKLRIGYHTDEHCLQEISLRVRRGRKSASSEPTERVKPHFKNDIGTDPGSFRYHTAGKPCGDRIF